MSKLIAPPHSRIEIMGYAEFVRKQLNIHNKYYIPILNIAENVIWQTDDSFIFQICEISEMPGEYANYCPESNTLNVRRDVYEDAYYGNPRHRYTIAHELGHYFMHDDITKFSRCGDNIEIPAYRDPEWQANVFASAFMMDKKLIRGMTPEEVARKCGTSVKSAEIALKYSKRDQQYN